jgi:hypothetical protein
MKINLKIAAFILIFINSLVIIGHILILLQVIPYNWVSGGLIASYEEQKQISIISIVILLCTIPINLWGANIILKNKLHIVLKILLWVLFAYSCIGFCMQILGTLFEKTVTSILCLVSAIMYFRLIIEKNKPKMK